MWLKCSRGVGWGEINNCSLSTSHPVSIDAVWIPQHLVLFCLPDKSMICPITPGPRAALNLTPVLMLIVVLCLLAGAARTSYKSTTAKVWKWKSKLANALRCCELTVALVAVQFLISHSHLMHFLLLCVIFLAELGWVGLSWAHESVIVSNRPSRAICFRFHHWPTKELLLFSHVLASLTSARMTAHIADALDCLGRPWPLHDVSVDCSSRVRSTNINL